MKPIYQSKNRHPMDKDMCCPKCGVLVYPDHYADGPKVEIGSLVDNEDYIGQGLKHEIEASCYTPLWNCVCGHSWDVKDLKEEI